MYIEVKQGILLKELFSCVWLLNRTVRFAEVWCFNKCFNTCRLIKFSVFQGEQSFSGLHLRMTFQSGKNEELVM